MLNLMLNPDTQAILLLCASFGENRNFGLQPLTLKEYNILAHWLKEENMTPQDLLEETVKNRLPKININNLDSERLVALLERGGMLALAVEKWTNQGLWILGRSDKNYPKYLKQKLKHLAPSLIYGVGNQNLLNNGGLGVVGSRDIDEEAVEYTRYIVQKCAQEEIQIISGGARGIDQTSMLESLKVGGKVVGILADSLAKNAVTKKYREFIKSQQLTLISTYDPSAGFSVGNAMGRNKYIYALSDYTLVVNSSIGQGGTWNGAIEALNKIKDTPVFVRMEGNIPDGNRQLYKKGCLFFPEIPFNKPIIKMIVNSLIPEPIQTEILIDNIIPKTEEKIEESTLEKPTKVNEINSNKNLPKTIYEVVLPLIIENLKINQPQSAKSLAENLKVRPAQIQDWLNKAVEQGIIIKNKKPVTFEINQNQSLF